MIVWIFFGSDECDDGALSAGGGTADGGAEVASAIGTAGRRMPGLEDGGS